MAASASATFAPTLAECRRAPSLQSATALYGVRLPVLPPRKRNITGGRIGTNIVVMAAGESLSSGETNESSTELPEIVKSAQEVWDKLDDKYAVVSLGVAFVIVLWGSTGLVSAIDRLPILPGIFELVGIGYTGWFVYRNIIFKPDREALVAKVKGTFNEVLGSS